ncbi:MAG: radical SAM protein [Candidatus Zixiibacteriota bacterium]|nr:MAG: radical SAM protein [candidate division Zixibacteria bacterium]
MKVHLINPPSPGQFGFTREGRCMQKEGVWTTTWPPISLTQTAAVLRARGHQVKVNDCSVEGIDTEKLKGELKAFQPDLLVMNSTTPSLNFDLTIPPQAREVLPGVKIAAFGIHAGTLPDEVFAMTGALDFIVRGEPEMTIADLADALAGKLPLEQVAGLSRRVDGAVQHTPDRGFIPVLDEMPYPAWDLVNLENYQLPFSGRRFLMVTTARGCPYDCVYCVAQSYYGKKIRARKPARIVDELEHMGAQYGVKDFFFWSESFTIIRAAIKELCREILRRNLKVRWVCNSRVDNIDLELLELMKQAGCWMISYGIESGEQAILDAIKKDITIKQVQEAVRLTRKVGFQIAGHFVLGLPGETPATLKKTYNFACSLDLDYAQFYCASPWPGSEFYRMAVESGWLASTDWEQYEQDHSVTNYPGLPAEEITRFRNWATRRYYLRPRIVWRTLRRINSPQELLHFLRMLRAFLTWV